MHSPATHAEPAPSARGCGAAADVGAMLERIPPGCTAIGADRLRNLPPSGRTTPGPVPVFRDGQFSGFVERGMEPQGISCGDQGDAELQRRLAEAVGRQDWLDPDHVGIAVENRVVRLSGRGDSPHAVLALRRLAAAAPCVAAIIDALWIDCE